MAQTAKIELPFPILRLFLPADGEVITQILNKDKWKNETEPFFRHEAIEFAFGRKIRATKEDRKKEEWWKPGIEDRVEKVRVQGGWRVHKKVIIHTDYFDGTFAADLALVIEQGELVPKISTLDIEWNKSVAGEIFAVVVEAIEPLVEKKLQEEINQFLKNKLSTLAKEFMEKNDKLKNIKARSTLSIKGTTIVLAVRID